MKPITEMNTEEAFAWIREQAPSAGEVVYTPEVDGTRKIGLRGATEKDAQRLRTALGLWSPLIGTGWKVEILPPLPHIGKVSGVWYVAPSGRALSPPMARSFRSTFAEACQLAQLAAIYSGVWRP